MTQTEVQKSMSALPPMTSTFEIQIQGRETNINWVGKFKYCRPSLGARGRIDVMRASLARDQVAIDPEIADLFAMVSHLRWTLVEYPTWWVDSNYGMDLYDANVVEAVYTKCLEFEREWKEKVFGGKTNDVPLGDTPSAAGGDA